MPVNSLVHGLYKIDYTPLQKLEEQTFDIRFFSLVIILGIRVLPGETAGVPAWL